MAIGRVINRVSFVILFDFTLLLLFFFCAFIWVGRRWSADHAVAFAGTLTTAAANIDGEIIAGFRRFNRMAPVFHR